MKKALITLSLLVAVGGAAWWGFLRAAQPGLDESIRTVADHVPGTVAWVGILPQMGEVDASLDAWRVAVRAFNADTRMVEVMQPERRVALGLDPERRAVIGQLAGVPHRALFAVVHRAPDAPSLDEALAATWPHVEITECESSLGPCRSMNDALRFVLDGQVLYLLQGGDGAHAALVDGLATPLGSDEVFRQTMRFDTRPVAAGFVRPSEWLASAVAMLPPYLPVDVDDAIEVLRDVEGMGIAVSRDTDLLVAEVSAFASAAASWTEVWSGGRSADLIDDLPGRADAFVHAQMDLDALSRSVRILLEGRPEIARRFDEVSEDVASYGIDDPFTIFDVFTGEFAGVSLRSGESVFVAGLEDPERVRSWLDARTVGITAPLRTVQVEDTTVFRPRILGVQLAAALRDGRLWFAEMPVMRELITGEREPLAADLSPSVLDAVRAGDPLVARLRPARVLDALNHTLPGSVSSLGEALTGVVDDAVVTAGTTGRFGHARIDIHVDDDALDALFDTQSVP